MAKGVTTGALSEDPLDYCILASGTAVAWVYAIELNLLIFLTFKRKGCLYFWSLLISSWGISLHGLGFILKFLVGTSWLLDIPIITTGWVAMVTSFRALFSPASGTSRPKNSSLHSMFDSVRCPRTTCSHCALYIRQQLNKCHQRELDI